MTELVNRLLTEFPLCDDCVINGLQLLGAGVGASLALLLVTAIFVVSVIHILKCYFLIHKIYREQNDLQAKEDLSHNE